LNASWRAPPSTSRLAGWQVARAKIAVGMPLFHFMQLVTFRKTLVTSKGCARFIIFEIPHAGNHCQQAEDSKASAEHREASCSFVVMSRVAKIGRCFADCKPFSSTFVAHKHKQAELACLIAPMGPVVATV
jgi:hypothetical protein